MMMIALEQTTVKHVQRRFARNFLRPLLHRLNKNMTGTRQSHTKGNGLIPSKIEKQICFLHEQSKNHQCAVTNSVKKKKLTTSFVGTVDPLMTKITLL